MDEEGIIIRQYSEEDREYVTLLMKKLCHTYNIDFDETRWKNSLENKFKNSDTTRLFVADKNSDVIGMLVADIRRNMNTGRNGYITNLIVSPDARQKGTGEKLVKKALEFFKANHVDSVKVNVRAKTEDARKLFVKLGFKQYVVQLKKEM